LLIPTAILRTTYKHQVMPGNALQINELGDLIIFLHTQSKILMSIEPRPAVWNIFTRNKSSQVINTSKGTRLN